MVLVAGVAAESFGAVDFSRYAPILERRPFSSPVVEEPSEAPPPTPTDTPPEFVRVLRMVAITESPAGVRVGFMNISQKPPKPYYLYVGDSEDGIQLMEADYDGEKALVRKDNEQFWITMGSGSAPQENVAPDVVPTENPHQRRGPRTTIPSPVASTGDGDSARPMSYAERRRQRIEQMQAQAQEARNISEEEAEKRLREYQMKLIREGKTPLPIPLTEEMDAQLVKEGFLPPME